RLLSLFLFGGARLRPRRACRYLYSGMPADRRGAGLWHSAIAAQNPPLGKYRTMSASLDELGAHVASSMTANVLGYEVRFGELTVRAKADAIVSVLTFLRDDPRCKFTTLIDLCGADYPEREKRFDVVYHMLSMQLNHRIRIKVETDEATPVPSVAKLF